MNNLAIALRYQGKYEQEHPSKLTSMDNLAAVLSDQGKYEQAEEMHRQELSCANGAGQRASIHIDNHK
jgi:hypothetical protein